MSTTDKALHDNKLSQLVLGGGAAASILLPQAVTKAMPQLFAGIAPVTAQTLPYCTGVCGSFSVAQALLVDARRCPIAQACAAAAVEAAWGA